MKYPTPGKLTAQLTPDQIRVAAAACEGLFAFNRRTLDSLRRAGVQYPDRAAMLIEFFVFAAAFAAIGTDQAENQFSDPEDFAAFARACFGQALLACRGEETRQ